MNNKSIPIHRLQNQQIAATNFKTPNELVNWMGAMQAQDYSMAKWAIGVRLPGSTDKSIDKAVSNGEILRTHVLRPTWHFVSPEDIRWMLKLTAPNIISSMKGRHKQLELDDATIKKSIRIIEKALSKGEHLKREVLVDLLEHAGIRTNDNRAAHILMFAELNGLICSGKLTGNKQTFAFLDERIPAQKNISKEESLKSLAIKYFQSHGPATLQDFIWWSGLKVKDAKLSLDLIKDEFLSVKIGEKEYYVKEKDYDRDKAGVKNKSSIFLLPAYDEFLISYKDRSASLDKVNSPKTISSNGIFRPIMVVDGKVVGIWRRTTSNNRSLIFIKYLTDCDNKIRSKINSLVLNYGIFLGRNTELIVE
ncbi:MAG: AlkZ family DNA glycosylase [Ignavibacteriales bacterium]|nr:MAG: AlkZ family DNA glycosylase [Ignavibacteriales bacterium]